MTLSGQSTLSEMMCQFLSEVIKSSYLTLQLSLLPLLQPRGLRVDVAEPPDRSWWPWITMGNKAIMESLQNLNGLCVSRKYMFTCKPLRYLVLFATAA